MADPASLRHRPGEPEPTQTHRLPAESSMNSPVLCASDREAGDAPDGCRKTFARPQWNIAPVEVLALP